MNGISWKKVDKEMGKQLSGLGGGLLLHACCGPCATAAVEKILPYIKPVLYWYNPNIYPFDEQQKRLESLRRVAEHFAVPLIVEDAPTEEEFFKMQGDVPFVEQGKRCLACYRMRLVKTAQRAKKEGIGAICTTLTVGPKKDAFAVNGVGSEVAGEYGLEWVAADFKKGGGFLRSTQLSRELGLYRQTHCGCKASLEERK